MESQEKPRLGHLQAKIDAGLLDRVGVLAIQRTVRERKKIHPRDIVTEALEAYLPEQEKKLLPVGT